MKYLLRTMLAILAAIMIAVPTIGGEGGENAGGVGVWILPRCGYVGGPPSNGPGGPMRVLPNFDDGVAMVVSADCGQVVATACDPLSGMIMPLAVSGRDVLLPAATMRAFVDAQVHNVEVLISNQAQNGYRITLRIHGNSESGSLQIH